MRYKLKEFEIRSENAAKPTTKPAAPLVRWLRGMRRVHSALDYGCGKLRYSGVIAGSCKTLTLVDSEIQLSREQQLGRVRTNVRSYMKRWPRCRVLNVEQFSKDRRTYDFVLCANVLSAIPDRQVRSMTLLSLASSLKRTGECLFVAQYRSSYFKEAAAGGAVPHLDGWILQTKRGAFYFGVLNIKKLSQLVQEHGFSVKRAWTKRESAYLLVGIRKKR